MSCSSRVLGIVSSSSARHLVPSVSQSVSCKSCYMMGCDMTPTHIDSRQLSNTHHMVGRKIGYLRGDMAAVGKSSANVGNIRISVGDRKCGKSPLFLRVSKNFGIIIHCCCICRHLLNILFVLQLYTLHCIGRATAISLQLMFHHIAEYGPAIQSFVSWRIIRAFQNFSNMCSVHCALCGCSCC